MASRYYSYNIKRPMSLVISSRHEYISKSTLLAPGFPRKNNNHCGVALGAYRGRLSSGFEIRKPDNAQDRGRHLKANKKLTFQPSSFFRLSSESHSGFTWR